MYWQRIRRGEISVENQKGPIAIDFVQQWGPSGSQHKIFKQP